VEYHAEALAVLDHLRERSQSEFVPGSYSKVDPELDPLRADAAGAEAALGRASELATALDARDLLPRVEEARAELARPGKDAAGSERALRTAARLHRENGEEWLAAQAEARIAP
jgi:hypothetical protein